jgi:hypothetical protein
MSFDVVLIALLVGGIALSAAYVRAEYLGWREHGAAERRKEAALRELHAASLSEQHNALLLPSVMKLQGFGTAEAANPDTAGEIAAARRASVPGSPRNPFEDRRKRDRQGATL